MHLKGWGVPGTDLTKAVQYLQVSAKSGNLLAAYDLALLHLAGSTTDPQPCLAAVALLKRVAEKGWPVLEVGGPREGRDGGWRRLPPFRRRRTLAPPKPPSVY